jgi:hypothetical protein
MALRESENIMTPRQRKLALGMGIGGLVLAVALWWFTKPSPPAPTSGAIYYTGPMVNKSRTMLVDEKGNIIKRLDPNRPDKDGSAINSDNNPPASAPEDTNTPAKP